MNDQEEVIVSHPGQLIELTFNAEDCTPDPPEFVTHIGPSRHLEGQTFPTPTESTARTARAFWLPVLGSFTEPVNGQETRLRVRGGARARQGRIIVECGVGRDERSGQEVDVSSPLCLVLVDRKTTGRRATEVTSFIPWTDVMAVRVESAGATKRSSRRKVRAKN